MKERLRNVAIPGLWLLFFLLIELVVYLFYGQPGLVQGFPVAFVWGAILTAFLHNLIYSEKKMSYVIDLLNKNIMIYDDSAPIPLTYDDKIVMFQVVTGEKPHLYVYDLAVMDVGQAHPDGIKSNAANLFGGRFTVHRLKAGKKGYLVEWKDGIWTVAKKLVWRSA